jgi:hypothetical protein
MAAAKTESGGILLFFVVLGGWVVSPSTTAFTLVDFPMTT